MKKYTTKQGSTGFIATVVTNNGTILPDFKVVVPFTSPKQFRLGSYDFMVYTVGSNKYQARAVQELPTSWFIKLNEV